MPSGEIRKELGRGINGGDVEAFAGTGAGHIEEVTLGGVNFLEIRLVGDVFDAFLERNNFVVAGHDDDRAEFEAFGH